MEPHDSEPVYGWLVIAHWKTHSLATFTLVDCDQEAALEAVREHMGFCWGRDGSWRFEALRVAVIAGQIERA